jgi:hypothetical protein
MKKYKNTKRSLRPWHFSLPARLNERARNDLPEEYTRRYCAFAMKAFWKLSFDRRPIRGRTTEDRKALRRY